MKTPDIHASDASLEARQVSKSFMSGAVRVHVLQGLSIAIYRGELTLISGPSGCGKSTLLSLLSGLQSPDQGQAWALGEDLGRMNKRQLERFRLQHTGFVFQGFNLFPALTAREQVQLPLGYLGLSNRDTGERALRALDEVGMAHRADARPAQLSGGEKQRVAIARALAKEPQLLFADEPTSALDADNGQKIIDILHRIARSHGTTVLCVSHDPRLVRHADRVLTMEDGLIKNDWQPQALEIPA
ncbi:ABC transporter ATP-binding protein [Rhodoferax koreense]|uniref:ABC transporter ATP-binding protein n=1 Tax=Rhodoferax koreensis TaxID=1842727 RepID=A0A1P8JS47_9BURK|nr:ABC transporter ATP-binding protein [Rhodoferax koreense]APW36570.1 ABC transporter ATP-binding protein [Rhodoferax koreense]